MGIEQEAAEDVPKEPSRGVSGMTADEQDELVATFIEAFDATEVYPDDC